MSKPAIAGRAAFIVGVFVICLGAFTALITTLMGFDFGLDFTGRPAGTTAQWLIAGGIVLAISTVLTWLVYGAIGGLNPQPAPELTPDQMAKISARIRTKRHGRGPMPGISPETRAVLGKLTDREIETLSDYFDLLADYLATIESLARAMSATDSRPGETDTNPQASPDADAH